MSKFRSLLIASTFALSLHSVEPTATQEIVDPAATIIGFDKLNEVQLSVWQVRRDKGADREDQREMNYQSS